MKLRANTSYRGTAWMVALLTASFSLAGQTSSRGRSNEPVEQLLERALDRIRGEIKRIPKSDLKQVAKELPGALKMPRDLLAHMESAVTALDSFDDVVTGYLVEAKRLQLMIARSAQRVDDASFRSMWRQCDAAYKLADERLSAAIVLFRKTGEQLSLEQVLGFTTWEMVCREFQEHRLQSMANALEATTKELSNASRSRK